MIRIKELREERHISQQRLALELFLSQATISKYELGLAEPDIPTIVKLCGYFQVSADYLLGISEVRQSVIKADLSDTEMQLIYDFKRLDGLQKEKLLAYLQGLTQQ